MASSFSMKNYVRPVTSVIVLLSLTAWLGITRKSVAPARLAASSKPNIVFILADDMGYGDPGCFNPSSKISTPAIDRLAAEGMKFVDAHSPGSWCVPSRYGLLTGQYPLHQTMKPELGALIDSSRITIASLLRRNGYRTGMVGKWHLGFTGVSNWQNVDYHQPLTGGPVDRGFDYFFGMHASLDIPPYFFIENRRAVAAPTEKIKAHQSPNATTSISGAFWREGRMAPGFNHVDVLPTFASKAVAFLEQAARNKTEPFFLYFAMTAPHTPWVAQPAFVGKSRAGEYGDFTMQVDHTVDQVLQTLTKLGLDDNTLVIFSSDNGPVWFREDIQKYGHRSAGRFRGMKLDAYEGGHRVPLVARWPGKIKPGSLSTQLVCFTDMLATFAAVVGDTLSPQAVTDSYDMLPVLLGKSRAKRNGLVVEDYCVREGNWKFISGNGTGPLQQKFGRVDAPPISGELYDLAKDPAETNNLYNKEPGRVTAFNVRLNQYKIQGAASKNSHLPK